MVKKAFKSPYIGTNTTGKYSIVYTEQGDFSVIIKCNNPILQYSADQDAYYSFHNLYSNIIKTLGVGYTLQKQDILTKKSFIGRESDDFLTQKYNENFNGRMFNEISTYFIITKVVKRSNFFNFDQKLFDIYLRNIEKVLEILQSNKLNPSILNEAEIGRYLKRMFAFNFSDETFSLNNIDSTDELLKIGDSVVKSLTLVDIDEINLPSDIKPYQERNDMGFPFPLDLMSFLHNIPGYESIVYNQVITIPDQQLEQNKLKIKRKRHDSMPDPANEVSVNDIDALLNDIAKNSQLLVYSHFNILVKAKEQEINRAINYIESSLFSSNITPSKNSWNQLELFRANLPGNSGELKIYDKFLTTSDAALCFFFKEKLLIDEESNFKIYFTDRQGIPVAIDTCDVPMQTGRITNRNVFVLGPSGSGKSFFMNALVRQYFLLDMDIILVDTGHSYWGLCSYYRGRYITYSEEKKITMNPFRIKREEYNEEKREFLKSLVGLLWKGSDGKLSQIEDSVLSSVVTEYYKDFFANRNNDSKYLSFNSFYEYSILKINDIKEKEGVPFNTQEYVFILKKFYKGGEYQEILNDDFDSTLFDESLIVFEIDAIKEHKILFPITTLIIMDVFLQKMRHKSNRKALIIEEAWKAIASPIMAGYLVYVYKTVRKFRGIACVVTQELDDILGNPIVKESILSNSDTVCLLDQTKFKDNYDSVAKLLSLNEIERRKIFTINNLDNKSGRRRFNEVYIKRGRTGEVYGVEVSMHEYLAFTTELTEKQAVNRYFLYYGDYREAIENFVEDLNKSELKLPRFVEMVNHPNYNFNRAGLHVA